MTKTERFYWLDETSGIYFLFEVNGATMGSERVGSFTKEQLAQEWCDAGLPSVS